MPFSDYSTDGIYIKNHVVKFKNKKDVKFNTVQDKSYFEEHLLETVN